MISRGIYGLMLNAPEGHLATWAINSSEVAFSGFIQGLSFGL